MNQRCNWMDPMAITRNLSPGKRLTARACLSSLAIAGLLLTNSLATAADPSQYLSSNGQHRLFNGAMPPGVIAATRQMAGPGGTAAMDVQAPYYQPVQIRGPQGVRFALPQMGAFQDPQPGLMAGLLVGQVYRFQISGIRGAEGAELFPTLEMVDRTYPPPGLATQYPIIVTIDEEDLQAALDGQLVTRVIYLEDPQTAVPLAQEPTTKSDVGGETPIDVSQFQDPLQVADRLGRVVAILRIGSLAPPRSPELAPQFFFGYPTWAPIFKPES
ncbi:hypothetical protein LOC70_08355 [Rhodopirellula sp. JC737]|nr:hypothetical protein [Rhodopirellula sp. JC737]